MPEYVGRDVLAPERRAILRRAERVLVDQSLDRIFIRAAEASDVLSGIGEENGETTGEAAVER